MSGRPGRAVLVPALLVLSALPALPTAPATARLPDLTGTEEPVRAKLEALDRRVSAAPDDAAAWGRIGMALDAHEYVEEAENAYRRAAALDGDDFRWPYFLATILEVREAEEALAWFEKALAVDPSYAPARVRYGELLERVGRPGEARVEFERARSLEPGNPFGPFGSGRLALEAGRTAEALELLEEAYRLRPGIKALVALLSQAHFRAGHRDVAQRYARESRSLPRTTFRRDPRRAEVAREAVDSNSHLRRAGNYRSVGMLDEARREIETALESQPERAEVHYTAAQIYDLAGDAERAVIAARRALALSRTMEDVRAILAGNLVKLQRLDEAAPEVARVLAADPDDLRMHLASAMIAIERDDFERLVVAVDEACRIGVPDASSRRLLAALLASTAGAFADLGAHAEAALRMERSLELTDSADPARATRHRALEEFRAGRGD